MMTRSFFGAIASVVLAIGLLLGSAKAGDDVFGRIKGLIGGDDDAQGGEQQPSAGKSDEGGLSGMLESLIGKTGAPGADLSDTEIDAGLREALHVGTERVVAQLGAVDGFNLDPAIHIPLPKGLARVQKALGAIGLSSLMDDLELRLNRAAELATPAAKELFFNAIEEMTLADARGILTGPDDSATRYFQGKMSQPLAQAMRPLVDDALKDAGAVQAYDRVMGEYRNLPFVPDVKADLSAHVLKLGIDGIFFYIAKEEAAIRNDPVARTTDLLRRVFG